MDVERIVICASVSCDRLCKFKYELVTTNHTMQERTVFLGDMSNPQTVVVSRIVPI